MRKTKDFLIIIAQLSMFPIFFLYSRMLGIERNYIKDLEKIGRKSLVIANHQTKLDPFIILAQFPLGVFLKMIPMRFPVAHREYEKYKILRILGCYDIGETKKNRMLGLYRTRQYLLDGYSVMIFPEGKLSKSDEMGDLQMGVSFLSNQAEKVLFVKIAGFNLKKDRRMLFSEIMEMREKKIDKNFLADQFISLSI